MDKDLSSRFDSWRYQPVWFNGGFILIEVHLDKDGRLLLWSDLNDEGRTFTGAYPAGESHESIIGDLKLMLADASKWEPVKYDDLRVGKTFNERRN